MFPLLAAVLVSGLAAFAQPVEIVNEYGAVEVEVVPRDYIQVWRAGEEPDSTEGLEVSRSPVTLRVEALPPEEGSADLLARIPLGTSFSIETSDGDIVVTGMVRRARIQSLRGGLTLNVPLETTQLNIEATGAPPRLDLPERPKVAVVSLPIHPRLRIWKLTHHLRSKDLAYGGIEAQLHAPPALTLRDWELPSAWPVKPHTHGEAVVRRLMAEGRRRSGGSRPVRRARSSPRSSEAPSDDALFTAEVRMVSLSVAVSDSEGRPLTGLGPRDFFVEEDGKAQDIRVVDPEESPFNLAILLDLSGSTSVDLEHMREATIRLVEAAGANDRVAIYAMAGSMFHRLASLTSDREALLERGARLPYPSGGSPIWDTIALAYEAELADHPGERNALVVISDGIDNRFSGQSVPSTLRAAQLIAAAGEMDARIYPILLLSGERFGRGWAAKARVRMEALAKESGGRLFTARSVADIEPVLPELTRELRSVYEIAYYPMNQDFDGNWRRVRIRIGDPKAGVRARPGYFAE